MTTPNTVQSSYLILFQECSLGKVYKLKICDITEEPITKKIEDHFEAVTFVQNKESTHDHRFKLSSSPCESDKESTYAKYPDLSGFGYGYVCKVAQCRIFSIECVGDDTIAKTCE